MEWGRAITAVLIYLVGVVFVGARSGLRRGMLAALFASFTYNFFLSDPRFRLGVSTVEELVPLVAFNLAAFTSGGLAGRLQDAVKAARRAEARNELLLSISDDLQRAVSVDHVIGIARESYARFGIPIVSLMVRTDGEVHRFDVTPQQVANEDEVDGATRVELVGPNGAMGGIIFGDPANIRSDFRMVDLRAAANLLMIALDRCMLIERLSNAVAVERSEKFKDALLSSVSHDLRTPLTVIEATASSLRSFRDQLSLQQQDEMLDAVAQQCARLNRYTANLLDMSRIQAGIRPETFSQIDVLEILGVALAAARDRFPGQIFEKSVSGEAFPVVANEPMLEQVLVNLLENAAIHGESSEPIVVEVTAHSDLVEVCIRDQGLGIEQSEHLFERFHRGSGSSRRQGSGLGLYIARGFTEAFGGSVNLERDPGSSRGSVATVRLPLAGHKIGQRE